MKNELSCCGLKLKDHCTAPNRIFRVVTESCISIENKITSHKKTIT